MKSVIPFTKELEFETKVSEITSISLEREFEVLKESIEGDLHVTGEYKSHEISVNVIPFSFKIPFSIDISKNVKKDSISLEISDFAYDIISDNKIKVHIELELEFEESENVLEEEPKRIDESDSIIDMMEERSILEQTEENDLPNEIVETKTEEKEILERVENEIMENNEQKKEEEREMDSNLLEEESSIFSKSDAKEEYMTYHIHIVKDGETLETICSDYHITGSYLTEYNDTLEINAGDKLLIPFENE